MPPSQLDVAGIPTYRLLAALYNAAQPSRDSLGLHPGLMELPEAAAILEGPMSESGIVDCLEGKKLFVVLDGKSLDPFGYDYYNGANTAWTVVEKLRDELRFGSAVEDREALLYQFHREREMTRRRLVTLWAS